MKTIFGYDSKDARDFGVIVSDRMYDVIKQFLVVHQMKNPKDVEFISDYHATERRRKNNGNSNRSNAHRLRKDKASFWIG